MSNAKFVLGDVVKLPGGHVGKIFAMKRGARGPEYLIEGASLRDWEAESSLSIVEAKAG